MLDQLNKPYPYGSTKKYWIQSILIGSFVFLFLFIFKPFGLHEMETTRLLRTTFQYGLISFGISSFICILLPLLFRSYFNEDTWTVSKEMLSILSIVLLTAIANYWYSAERGFIRFDLQGFLKMSGFTLALGAIVIFIMITFKMNQALKQNLQKAQQMNQHLQNTSNSIPTPKAESVKMLLLPSEVEKQQLSIDPASLIYITSIGNYLECIYLSSTNQLQKHRLRNRMKVIEEIVQSYPNFFRCHRAFIINTAYIQSIEGNAKGYQLLMKHIESSIPVARSKSVQLQALLV